MFKTRVVTALVLFVLLMAAVFYLPETGWMWFCSALMGAAAWEWCALAGLNGRVARFYPYISALLFAVLAWQRLPQNILLGIFALVSLFWLLLVPVWLLFKWRLGTAGNLNVLLGWAILLPAGLSLLVLRGDGWLLLSVLMVAWVADTFAYFSGRLFGRHKLAPFISPGKSWEGVGGALLAVSLYIWFLPKPLIRFAGADWLASFMAQKVAWFIAGALLVAVCVVGDLLESLFKRQAGLKDSGKLLPGHGGVLDRIDSLLALLPVAAAMYLLHILFFAASVGK